MKAWFTAQPFLVPRRKLLELLVLLALDLILFFVFKSVTPVMLVSLGFIWNWAASQELAYVLENRRYRFSLMKMVYNLHTIVLLPVKRFHPLFGFIPKLLPAGLFWILIIHFTESSIDWWPPFLGSFFFELTQFDFYLKRREPAPAP